MERVIQVINRMKADGVIENYAIGGGIAAVYYLEPYQTDDLDVFIPVSTVAFGSAGLLSLDPIYSYLKSRGYHAAKEGVLIEDWLVQFIPASESIQEEAIRHANEITYGKTQTRIFSPEYLAGELLRSGRLKDQVRVIALIESGRLEMDTFRGIIERYELSEKWATLKRRFDVEA